MVESEESMKFYIPVFNNKWSVVEIDTEKTLAGLKQFRTFETPGYNRTIIYCGTIYNGEHCFKTEDAAWKWIKKDYSCYKEKVKEFH